MIRNFRIAIGFIFTFFSTVSIFAICKFIFGEPFGSRGEMIPAEPRWIAFFLACALISLSVLWFSRERT